jgi:hypothetical protein
MPSRKRRDQDAALEARRILCADEASAKVEAVRRQEREPDPEIGWSYVLRTGQWSAVPSIDRPEPLWRALLSSIDWLQ